MGCIGVDVVVVVIVVVVPLGVVWWVGFGFGVTEWRSVNGGGGVSVTMAPNRNPLIEAIVFPCSKTIKKASLAITFQYCDIAILLPVLVG